MKLVAKVRLCPTDIQHKLLIDTIEQANDACNTISKIAWDTLNFRQYNIHKAIYSDIRSSTGLTAQVVVRCIAKVADAYKLDKNSIRTFKPHGAIAYDDRILRWYTDKNFVSIWTVDGREKISYKTGDLQHYYMQFQQGESDLVFYKGVFYLFATCNIPDPTPKDVEGVIGVDFGIVNIATDSDEHIYSGKRIEKSRIRYERIRTQLQSKSTKATRRKLKQLSGKQQRFQKDTNHVISKCIVATAEHTNRAIAIEDLKGIRSKTRVRSKEQRARHSNWGFYQLRSFIEYKAKKAGVPVITVDPHYTSQRCNVCGHTEKANRKTQSNFVCMSCGHSNLADVNAAKNISWVAINQPIVSNAIAFAFAVSGTSHSL